VDEVIIIDGGSYKHHIDNINKWFKDPRIRIIHNEFEGLDGMQRNKYLEYASKDWILVIDSDEVLSDNGYELKEIAKQSKNNTTVYDVHMIHFIYNLNNVDTTRPKHYVPRRFFKNVPGMQYEDLLKHPVLKGPFTNVGLIDNVTIYHYSHCKGLLHSVRWKYEDNIKRSKMHDPKFMNWWRKALLLGYYNTAPLVKGSDEEIASLHPYPIRRLIIEDVEREWKNYLVNE